jgi:hypothetical protein
MGRFAYLVHGMFRKNSTKTMMLALLSDEVAKFTRMWPRFVAKWREVMFFCCERKKTRRRRRRKRKGDGLLLVTTVLNFRWKLAMKYFPR